MKPKTISQLLREIHRARINELNDPSYSQVDLADWFGIEQSLFNHYYLGRRQPSRENAEKLAAKAGPIVFDIMGLARPDNRLAEMRAEYDTVPEQARDDYLEEIKKLTHEFLTARGYRLVDRNTPKSP